LAFFSEVLFTEAAEDGDTWVPDTGATHHMTKSADNFVSYIAFDEPKQITLGNQKLMLAYGRGDVMIEALVGNKWFKHCLKDVWYTPDVIKNLFSVPTAADKGFEYWLNKDSCRITQNGEPVIIGNRHHLLYKLSVRVVKPDVPAQVYTAQKIDTLQTWHERLGHQSKAHVEKYLKRQGIDYIKDDKVCEGCILGKHHRLSFGTRANDVSQPGDLVHSDVCGPMQEESFSHSRYFVTFKDEYSKFRSVYFMKKKSEVSEKLKYFLAEARTLKHVVKELLTDGGGEYDNKEMEQITREAGLKHRKSMPFTPEQNGAAERENRTLIEAARSMLQAKGLPNKLWAEAVNTAAYILNRSGPTKVDGKTPYELWYGKEAVMDHLKIFGTECFVHVPKQRRQKLDAKSIKGYLVGYCDNKDGYRVYVAEQDTVILSRDVIFKEETETVCEQIEQKAEDAVKVQFDPPVNSKMKMMKMQLVDKIFEIEGRLELLSDTMIMQ
jgi:hypothetical protein